MAIFDFGTVLKLVVVNAVAVAMLFSRYSDTQPGVKFIVQVQARLSRHSSGAAQRCGLIKWDSYTIASYRVMLPDGQRPAAVHVVDGKIHAITTDAHQFGLKVLNFKNAVIMPGLIDVHTHLNEPGREQWEGISTGTQAAAAGGITTVVDMPLNSFPTAIVPERITLKQELAKEKAHVDVGHWAGLVHSNARDEATLQGLLDAGALGFKSFMCPSGINDFEHVTVQDIADALPFLKRAGVPLLLHAELISDVPPPEGDPTDYRTYMNTRPPKFEQDAVAAIIQLLDNSTAVPAMPGFGLHIVHLADAGSIEMIKAARTRGHPLTVETCSHYLAFNEAMVGRGQTWFKCAPPIRDEANQQALIDALGAGDIQLLASDHSPSTVDLKLVETGDFLNAWGGMSGLQYTLPGAWTALYNRFAAHLEEGSAAVVKRLLRRLTDAAAAQPANLAGLGYRKGKIAVGYDADFVIWDPDASADTTVEGNRHQHKLSPYVDQPLLGRVLATVVRGQAVFLYGDLSHKPCGGPIAAAQ